MLSEDTKKLVINEIQRHYAEQTQPYYLAELGLFFRSEGIEVPDGKRFKDFLSENFQSVLAIVQDPTVPAKVAMALLDNREQVQQQLAGRFMSAPGRPPIEVNRLPFSLIAAFCQKPVPSDRVYYRPVPPCRYVIASAAPDDSYVEIGDEFRQSVPGGTPVHAIPSGVRQEIYHRIDEWAAAQNINLETIYMGERGRSPSSSANRGIPVSNALQRLIEAQEAGLRKSIRIPGDIALALMRLE